MANNTTDSESQGTPVWPCVGEPLYQAARVAFIVLGSAMILSAVVGNTSLITIVVRHFLRNRRKRLQHLFIVNLALSDLLILGYWFTFFVLDLALGHHPVFNVAHCVANGVIASVTYMVSITCLMCISFNRYLHVCHTHLYSRVFTLPRTVCWCLLVWLFSLSLLLPVLWGGAAGSFHYILRTHVCSYSREGLTYMKVMIITYSIVPPFITAYFNLAIFRFWRKARMSLTLRYPTAPTKQSRRTGLIAKWKAWRNKKSVSGFALAAETGKGEGFDGNNEPTCSSAFKPEDESAAQRWVDTEGGDTGFANTEENHPRQADDATVTQTEEAVLGVCEEAEPSSAAYESCLFSNIEDTDSESNETSTNIDSQIQKSDSRNPVRNLLHTFAKAKNGHVPRCVAARGNGKSADGTPTVASSPGSRAPPSRTSRQSHSSKNGKRSKNSGTRNMRERRKKSKIREAAFVRSLMIVCLLMFAVFVPYAATVIIESFIETPPDFAAAGIVLLLLNNSVNWIVYGIMNPAFKKSYAKYGRKIINACCRVTRTRAECTPARALDDNLVPEAMHNDSTSAKETNRIGD